MGTGDPGRFVPRRERGRWFHLADCARIFGHPGDAGTADSAPPVAPAHAVDRGGRLDTGFGVPQGRVLALTV
jgi:hypothetical protein